MCEEAIYVDLKDTIEKRIPEVEMKTITKYAIGLLSDDKTKIISLVSEFYLDDYEYLKYSCEYTSCIENASKFNSIKDLAEWIKDNVPKKSTEYFLKKHCLIKLVTTVAEDEHNLKTIPTLDVSFHNRLIFVED